jgi:hypothetical protein
MSSHWAAFLCIDSSPARQQQVFLSEHFQQHTPQQPDEAVTGAT